ncbi:FadR/GntR family transcriptional regulator (plasmid) [Herbiconiux sp. KACC 21604]|uniref:FadR/GntR family transcriptional regulator n=1 Tax=unclassified Herbiconiux TaxID=2618217 RepID=UPI001491CB8B|nr:MULTISPECIES: FadR/GntR family transcriptional regulator [unclassified Herbiconiux]QJU56316.1 FadR family transcriptional regulator [Herbiconiux sp. SALV-R1]WPO88823.1 FadR/GntR family transcriptional regulator [Herbiconiux sp. KACC 21604]
MNGKRLGQLPISREELLTELEHTLTEGDFAPGDRLPSERALSETYGVSRPVVREVIQRLRERGLLHVAPGSGTYLREPSALDWARPLDAVSRRSGTTIRQLVEARVMLEEKAARLAAENATDDDFDKLSRALDAFNSPGGIIDRARADIAFHALIARASHNPVLEMMFGSIAPLAFEVMLRSLDDKDVMREGAPLHEDALQALKARDGEQAAALIGKHIRLAATLFGDDYEKSVERVARSKVQALFGPNASLEEVVADALS